MHIKKQIEAYKNQDVKWSPVIIEAQALEEAHAVIASFDKSFWHSEEDRLAALLLAPVFATGPTWIPDVTFKATSLAGWHVLGQADWRAQNGEVVGTVKPGGSGGWLVLDRSYQDVGFYASFRSTGDCRTGVLLRAENCADTDLPARHEQAYSRRNEAGSGSGEQHQLDAAAVAHAPRSEQSDDVFAVARRRQHPVQRDDVQPVHHRPCSHVPPVHQRLYED